MSVAGYRPISLIVDMMSTTESSEKSEPRLSFRGCGPMSGLGPASGAGSGLGPASGAGSAVSGQGSLVGASPSFSSQDGPRNMGNGWVYLLWMHSVHTPQTHMSDFSRFDKFPDCVADRL